MDGFWENSLYLTKEHVNTENKEKYMLFVNV